MNDTESIEFENLTKKDISDLKLIISKHIEYTDSTLGRKIISNWDAEVKHFIKVMPTEYKKALKKMSLDKKTLNKLY